jgi:hypothetical protein
MRSVSTITNLRKYYILLITSCLCWFGSLAQENSPYTRFGLGDILPTQNILNRGMGGMSLAYYDLQSINFTNPASYARLKLTTFDVGIDYSSRRLRTSNTANSYRSANLIPSYMNVGFPLSKKKNWGMNFGLKPVTRINYDISNNSRLPGIDSVYNQYQGNGGSYQIFTGLAYGRKNFSIGFNAGWMFGNKENSTRLVFINDTLNYLKAKYSDSTNFGGIFVKAGIQYQFVISGDKNLRIGATYGLEQKMDAKRSITRYTYDFGTRGDIVLDSIYRSVGEKGEIILPMNYGVAVLFEKIDNWMIGVEFNAAEWSAFRYYGEPGQLRDNWTLRLGGQLIPGITSKTYWNRVAYRAGFYYGPEYIDLGTQFNSWAVTFGAGLPIRRNFYTNQYTTLNTSFEIGARGNKSNPIRENVFRISIGFNLSDIWFNKREYQ